MSGVIRIAVSSGHLKGVDIKSLKRYAQVRMMAGTVLGSRSEAPETIEELQEATGL